MQSLYDGDAAIKWYDADEGGELLGEGHSLLVPVEGRPHRLCPGDAPEKTGRLGNEDGGSIQAGNTLPGLSSVRCLRSFHLRSVKVYAEEPGVPPHQTDQA